MKQKYILVECNSQPSRNGVTMWRMTFYCLDDGSLWETTVDPTYKNFRRSGWDHIVEHDNPWGVYEGMKRTKRKTQDGTPVLSADSKPHLQIRCEDHAQARALVELNEREIKPTPFERLFDDC